MWIQLSGGHGRRLFVSSEVNETSVPAAASRDYYPAEETMALASS